MKWLDDIINTFQDANKDILISSGASPSGVYHVGHLREIVIADAVVRALKRAVLRARHVHVSDNLDGRSICRPVTNSTWVCHSVRCHHQMIGKIRGRGFLPKAIPRQCR